MYERVIDRRLKIKYEFDVLIIIKYIDQVLPCEYPRM